MVLRREAPKTFQNHSNTVQNALKRLKPIQNGPKRVFHEQNSRGLGRNLSKTEAPRPPRLCMMAVAGQDRRAWGPGWQRENGTRATGSNLFTEGL